jgi:TRAP-type uncharacterized transport system fused permease subunit
MAACKWEGHMMLFRRIANGFKLQQYARKATEIILIISSFFVLYTSGFGLLSAMSQPVYTGFLWFPASFFYTRYPKKANLPYGISCYLSSLWPRLYMSRSRGKKCPAHYESRRVGDGGLRGRLLLILEATRRSMGAAMPVIAVISLALPILGPYLPEF